MEQLADVHSVIVVNMNEYNAQDKNGNQVKLSPYMKNKIYREAKELKGKIKDNLCTKGECWNPTNSNIYKMAHREMGMNPDKVRFDALMGNLGADPKDKNLERLRR